MKLQTVTDEALYIVTSRVYQMLSSWQQCTMSDASVVKLNVVEHKFTQPHHKKVCSRAPLIGIAASGWLKPVHRTAGSSALAPPVFVRGLEVILSLSLCCRSLFLWHPRFNLPSVKAGEIHHIRGHVPRLSPTALGSSPWEDTEPELVWPSASGLPWSFHSSPPTSLKGMECLFAFPSDPLLAGKIPVGCFYLGASHWPAHLSTVLDLDTHKSAPTSRPLRALLTIPLTIDTRHRSSFAQSLGPRTVVSEIIFFNYSEVPLASCEEHISCNRFHWDLVAPFLRLLLRGMLFLPFGHWPSNVSLRMESMMEQAFLSNLVKIRALSQLNLSSLIFEN